MSTPVTTTTFACIVSMSYSRAIGDGGNIPWWVEEDMRYFYKTTVGNGKNAVIMGKNTWFGIPASKRPLKNRLNIIISTTLKPDEDDTQGCLIFSSFEQAVNETRKMKELENVWIIGGETIYRQALAFPNLISKVYITKIPNRLINDEEIDTLYFGLVLIRKRTFDTWFPDLDYDVFELEEEFESEINEGVVFQIWGRYSL